MRTIDETDVRILNLLKTNARIPLKEISAEIHLTAPAVSSRIEKLEKAGYIKGYHAAVDLDMLGYKVKAFIQISVPPTESERFAAFIQKESAVLECSHITGAYSMLLKVVFPSTSDLDKFIGKLQTFGKTETQVVFSTLIERH